MIEGNEIPDQLPVAQPTQPHPDAHAAAKLNVVLAAAPHLINHPDLAHAASLADDPADAAQGIAGLHLGVAALARAEQWTKDKASEFKAANPGYGDLAPRQQPQTDQGGEGVGTATVTGGPGFWDWLHPVEKAFDGYGHALSHAVGQELHFLQGLGVGSYDIARNPSAFIDRVPGVSYFTNTVGNAMGNVATAGGAGGYDSSQGTGDYHASHFLLNGAKAVTSMPAQWQQLYRAAVAADQKGGAEEVGKVMSGAVIGAAAGWFAGGFDGLSAGASDAASTAAGDMAISDIANSTGDVTNAAANESGVNGPASGLTAEEQATAAHSAAVARLTAIRNAIIAAKNQIFAETNIDSIAGLRANANALDTESLAEQLIKRFEKIASADTTIGQISDSLRGVIEEEMKTTAENMGSMRDLIHPAVRIGAKVVQLAKPLFKVIGVPFRLMHYLTTDEAIGAAYAGTNYIQAYHPDIWAKAQSGETIGQGLSQAFGLGKSSFLSGATDFIVSLVEPQFLVGRSMATGDALATTADDLEHAFAVSPRYRAALAIMKGKTAVELQRIFKNLTPEMADYIAKNNAKIGDIHNALVDALKAQDLTNGFRIPRIGLYGAIKSAKLSDNAVADFFSRMFRQMPVTFTKEGVISASVFNPEDDHFVNGLGQMLRGLGFSNNATNLALDDILAALAEGSRRKLENTLKNALAQGLFEMVDQEMHSNLKTDGGPLSWLESGHQAQKLIDAEIAIQIRSAIIRNDMRAIEGDVAMFGPKRVEPNQPGFEAAQAEIDKMQKELDGLLSGTVEAPPVEGAPDLSKFTPEQVDRVQSLIEKRNKIVDDITKLSNGSFFDEELQAKLEEISKGTRLLTAEEREQINAALSRIDDALGPYKNRYEATRKAILDFVDKSVGGVGGGDEAAAFGSGADGVNTGRSQSGNTTSAIWFNNRGDLRFVNYRDFAQEVRALVKDTVTGLRKDRVKLVEQANNDVNALLARLKDDPENGYLQTELDNAREKLAQAKERQWDATARAKSATALRFFHATDGMNTWINDKWFKPLALMTPGWAIRVSMSELGLNVARLGPLNLIAGYSSASIIRNIRSSILMSAAIKDEDNRAQLYLLNSELDKLRNRTVGLTTEETQRMEDLKRAIARLTNKVTPSEIEEQLWRVLDDEFRSSEIAQRMKQAEQEAAHTQQLIYKTKGAAEEELRSRRATIKAQMSDVMETNRLAIENQLSEGGYSAVPHPPPATRYKDSFGVTRYKRSGGEWDWWDYIGPQEQRRLIKNRWVMPEYQPGLGVDEVFPSSVGSDFQDQIDKWLQATRNHDIAQYIINTGKLPLTKTGDIMPAYGIDFSPFALSLHDTSYGDQGLNENYDIRNLFGKREEAIKNIRAERTNANLREYATDWVSGTRRSLDGIAAEPWRMDYDTWIGRVADLEPQVERIYADLAERQKVDEWADLTPEEAKVIAEYRGLYPHDIPGYKGDTYTSLLERPIEEWDKTYNAMIGAARLAGEDTLPYYVERTGADNSPVWINSDIKQSELDMMTPKGVEQILAEYGYKSVKPGILRNIALFVRGIMIGMNMNILEGLGREEFIKTATRFGFEHDGYLPDAVNSSHHYLAESELDTASKGYTVKDRKFGKGQKFKRVKFSNEFGPLGFGKTGYHEAWKYQVQTVSGDEVFGRKLAKAYRELASQYFDGMKPKEGADMAMFRLKAQTAARNILDNTPKNLLKEMDLSHDIGYGSSAGTDPLDNYAKEAVRALEGVVRGMGKNGDGLDGILHEELLKDITEQTVPMDLKGFMDKYAYDTRDGQRKLWDPVDVAASHNGRLPDTANFQFIQKASNVLHEKALGPIVNRLVREPVFILEYMDVRQALERRVEEGLMTADQIDLMAKTEAAQNMVRYIHNPLDKTKFEENMRVVAPFYFAQNQAYRRAGRLFASNPGAFMQYVAMELAVTKWLAKMSAKNGMAIFTLPLAAFGFGIPGASGIPLTGSLSTVASIDPFANVTGLEGNTTAGGAMGLSNLAKSMFGMFKPNFGPVITVPAYFMTHAMGLTPQTIDDILGVFGVHNQQAGYDINNWIQNQTLGPIASQTPFWEQFVPNTLAREIIQAAAFKFGINKFELDTQLIQAQNEAFASLIGQRAHAYMMKLINEDPKWHEPSHWATIEQQVIFRESQWANPDYSINKDMWAEAHTMALETWAKKIILGFASPVSIGIGRAGGDAYNEYQAFLNKYATEANPYKGMDLFEYEHPDEIVYAVGQSHSVLGNYVPETASVLQAVDNNTAMVQQNPLAAWAYIGGVGVKGNFNEGASQALLANGVRARNLPDDFNKALQQMLGNIWYFDTLKPAYDKYLAEGATKSQLYPWEQAAITQYGNQDNPWWLENFRNFSSTTTASRAWNQLDLMSQQPQYNVGQYKKVSDGVKWFKADVYPALQQALTEANTSGSGATYAAVNTWWKDQVMPWVLEKHPELKYAVASIFSNMG